MLPRWLGRASALRWVWPAATPQSKGPFSDTSDTVFAVTGGTGLFENARGSMSVRSINGGAEYEQTFSLIP